MIVPNYVPDPIEIPNNVTLAPYGVRLAFIRRVLLIHLASTLIVALVAVVPSITVTLFPISVTLVAALIGLCIVRIAMRGRKPEVLFSASLLGPLLIVVGLFMKAVWATGFPIWPPVVGIAAFNLYSLFCGRDFSFVGGYVLALLLSAVAIAGISLAVGHPGVYALRAQLVNLAYLTYYVYDSASLLSRRRLGEELAAVTDLYRDVLNIFGYVPRVVQHWHKHRIWQIR